MMIPEPHPYDPDDPTYYDETSEELGFQHGRAEHRDGGSAG
jgi:hypothetical protein